MRNFFFTRYRNHKKYLAELAMALAASAGLAAGTAQAAPIAIPNAGFETNTGAGNFQSINVAPPWTGSGNWVGGGYGTLAHSGSNFAWVDFNQTITQTLTLGGSGAGYAWAEGTYTLNGFLRTAFSNASDQSVTTELLNGATSLGSISTTANGFMNWFALNTLTVVIGASNPNIGAPITLRITGIGVDQGGAHRGLDDFSLNFEPALVPEPSSVALLSMGAGGLGIIARRRRRSSR
jgi:hypothetical protein